MIDGTTVYPEEAEANMRFQPGRILIDDVARLRDALDKWRAAGQ